MKVSVNREWFDQEIRRGVGLGDIIKKVTMAVGIKPCAGCERRRRYLNRIRVPVPFVRW